LAWAGRMLRPRPGGPAACVRAPPRSSIRGRVGPYRARSAASGQRPYHVTMLAGDQERDRATAALRRHYASGRLGVEELSHRTGIALGARSHSDLRRALRDLPFGRWEPTWSVYLPGRLLVRRARRWALGLALLAVWAVMSSVLVLLFGLAV